MKLRFVEINQFQSVFKVTQIWGVDFFLASAVTESNVRMLKGTSDIALVMEYLALNGIGNRHDWDFFVNCPLSKCFCIFCRRQKTSQESQATV